MKIWKQFMIIWFGLVSITLTVLFLIFNSLGIPLIITQTVIVFGVIFACIMIPFDVRFLYELEKDEELL